MPLDPQGIAVVQLAFALTRNVAALHMPDINLPRHGFDSGSCALSAVLSASTNG